jgi:hypothetical protein
MYFTKETGLFQPMYKSISADSRLGELFQRTIKVCFCLMLCTLAGCLVGPKYKTPVATAETPPSSYKESPTQFKDAKGWKVARPQDTKTLWKRGLWWLRRKLSFIRL